MDVMEKIAVVRGNERSLFSLCLVVERKAGLMTVRKQYKYHTAISSSVEYCLHPSAYLSAVLEII
jgi:hypothetical protein